MAKRSKKFSPDLTAEDVLGIWQQAIDEPEEQRLRSLSREFRALCRLEHEVTIPAQYKAITRQVRTPYIRDTHQRVTASLVAKSPVAHIEPLDDDNREYRDAANIGERWDMAVIERMNKETGQDVVYDDSAGLVRDGESVIKVVHRPDAWANFPQRERETEDEEGQRQKVTKDADEYTKETDRFKRTAGLPIAWRAVDRLTTVFENGEFGDQWALEWGAYSTPYIKSRYYSGRQPIPEPTEQMVAINTITGQPRPVDGVMPGSMQATKLEYVDEREWHVLINGSEAPGWPKPNPYAPKLNYFRAKAYESDSLLYSLLFLVPRLDELLTMKLNWAYLGAYPNPVLETQPNAMGDSLLGAMPSSLSVSGEGENGMGNTLTWSPGKLMDLPIGRTLRFLVPPPVGADINQMVTLFMSLIDIAGIPSVFRGVGGANQPGYAINQLMAAASMAYKIAALSLQRQHEQAIEFTHWLVPNIIKQAVYVNGWERINKKTGRPATNAGRAWLGLTDQDKGGKNLAPVSKLGPLTFAFRPTLPTDEQARAMIANQLVNAPKPLSSVRHALESYLQEEDPDGIMDEIAVEKALESEPLASMVQEAALQDAGIIPPKTAGSGLVDQYGQPLSSQQGGNGQAMLPAGPNDLQPVPVSPNQMVSGTPAVAGITMPIVPSAPQASPIMSGQGGRVAGSYPGLPAGQGG